MPPDRVAFILGWLFLAAYVAGHIARAIINRRPRWKR